MNKTLMVALMLMTAAAWSQAGVERITEGGVWLDVEAHRPDNEPAVVVLHVPWQQDSVNLVQEIEDWASNYPDLTILLVDCVDPRTQVYRQFNLREIPAIIIVDRRGEQVGGPLTTVSDLEQTLSDNGLLR
ncbi:MAG TPA: hypothetical protein PKE26_03035 [Kiritimatiellia bacterium]|nr:hypothetical protein [Kiritimatiellia bacterium]HMO98064.1 hypothetical protein [Kiritimatiellia bacterium]HMP97010.1 hypothetical protein [Kiritimatiellia bacterium]